MTNVLRMMQFSVKKFKNMAGKEENVVFLLIDRLNNHLVAFYLNG